MTSPAKDQVKRGYNNCEVFVGDVVIKIMNLPSNSNEDYVKKLFEGYGEIEKVAVLVKGIPPVGFVKFARPADLEVAVKEMNEKVVQGPNGGPTCILSVEVARPHQSQSIPLSAYSIDKQTRNDTTMQDIGASPSSSRGHT